MFVFAGSLPGLDRWPLSCRRAGGSPLGGRHAVGARGCGARSTRWFGLTVTCRGRGLPFHSREDGAQRALLKAGSAQRRSQHLKPGSLAPGPTLPASTRTLLLLEKGDPPGSKQPFQRAARSYPCCSLFSGFRVPLCVGGEVVAPFLLPFFLSFPTLCLCFCGGSRDQTCSSLSPAAFRGGSWGYPWASMPVGVLRGAANGGPVPALPAPLCTRAQ